MVRHPNEPHVVWSIAGFDPSSGAGITADLLTFAAHGLFGCSAITALTAQSTMGVRATEPVSAKFLAETLSTLREDLPPVGVKVGMVCNAELMTTVAHMLSAYKAEHGTKMDNVHKIQNQSFVVLDPVFRSSSGRELYPSDQLAGLKEQLLPWVDVITPNWLELSALTGEVVDSLERADRSARTLIAMVPSLHVAVTGGDQAKPIDLLVSPSSETRYFEGEHIVSQATHGTGCAFSSALLANLVLGRDLPSAMAAAKVFVSEAIRKAPRLGHGRGPLNFLWNRPLPGEAHDAA